jgi:hypothetical protein
VDRDLAAGLGLSRSTKRVTGNSNRIGGEKMNANINQATIPTLVNSEEQTGAAMQRAQYAMLNELPGVVFGFLTLAWIVTSLFGLV